MENVPTYAKLGQVKNQADAVALPPLSPQQESVLLLYEQQMNYLNILNYL